MTRALEQYLRPGVNGTAFCPGCGHGIIMGSVLRAVERLQIPQEKLLFVSGIGCAAWIPSPNFATDTLHTLHGRALAFATGVKLSKPDLTVVVVSGDGDLTSIGGNHLIHSARRGLDVTVICANNQIYGMTGGQTASTTPTGAQTATDPYGNPFMPFDVCALVMAAGATYSARYPVTRPILLIDAMVRAIETPGFSLVEALSPCPTQFGRRNGMDDISALFDYTDKMCITQEEASASTEGNRDNRIVIGEFYND